MQAMILHEHASVDASPLRLEEVAEPTPGPGQVRMKVSACAVCRTDLHVIEGDLPPQRMPIIPGHQVVGVVDRVGEGVSTVRVGQRVGVGWLRHVDGDCRFCRRGLENLCPASRYTGYHEHGGYAPYAVAPADFAHVLPAHYDDPSVSPLLCAGLIGYRALQRAQTPDGGRLLLVGFGASAHLVMQIAVHRGYRVYVASQTAAHRELAESMGAHWTGADLADCPDKVDAAVLFAPAGRLVPGCLEALDRGGKLSIAGIHLTDVPTLNYEQHLFYEKEVRSVTANTRADARALLSEAVAANVQPRTTAYPLADANRALQDVKHSRIDGAAVLMI